ncbi:MAG: hypothetical protein JSW66_10700 [Phycisphaerales bacterium]|nr:MAG: hypothetical protein JSW66_10700 [Phycisphaerales bacterium]
MGRRRSYLAVLTLLIACRQLCIGAEKPASPADTNTAPVQAKSDDEVDVIALLQGSEEERLKAASAMLFSDNPLARKTLLDVLRQGKNSAARMAVCRALIQTPSSKDLVKNKDDFIAPLLGVLDTELEDEAQLAADATSIFEYEKIGKLLEDTVTDASRPVRTRLNVIRALSRRPDMMAAIQLIRLVDDSDKQVARASEEALRSLSIPVGRDAQTRETIISELKRKGRNEFLKDWLIRQEAQIRLMRNDLEFWRGGYLAALGKLYGAVGDDAAKGVFLDEHLRSPKAEVRLWALERAYEWRVAPGAKLPEKLGPVLISLISDPDKAVRLETAAVLSVMGEINSAQSLLAQLEAEQDDEVATELFGALGDACYIAFLPNSTIKIPVEIRQQTLEWAEKYLTDPAPAKAQKGAEVMRKLLGQDGLAPEEADNYLALLASTYGGLKNDPDGTLRGELLNAMASLCSPQSVHRARARKQFSALFEAALSDKTDFVREVAADGLIYIDKAYALGLLRKLANDPSAILRKKVIALAGEVGGKDDLDWLSEKLGLNAEGEPAWQAMLKILNDSDAATWQLWTDGLTSDSSKLTNDQKIALLKAAEAVGAGEFRSDVRKKLAELYYATGQFEAAADYLGLQYEAAKTEQEKEEISSRLSQACLKASKGEPLAGLVEDYLSKADFDPNDALMQSINAYFTQPPAGANPAAILKALEAITVPMSRPKWQQKLAAWKAGLSKKAEAAKAQ